MAKKGQERRGLGRGLSALMSDVAADDAAQQGEAPAIRADRVIPVEKIVPNPDQPRRDFGKDDLNDLAASIREKGIIQPLIVRENQRKHGTFEIVAGERRWRAAQLAKLHEVPALIREYSDAEVLEIAIIENVQRADLNPIEEAAGYRQLMDRFGHTQEKMAEALGKSRSHIANLLRLLQLPEEVQSFLRDGKLTAGHARALVTSDNAVDLARHIIAKGLSVREAEKLAKSPATKGRERPHPRPAKDADTEALEADLSANLGMKVNVQHTAGQQAGKITISYKSLDQLDELCRVLTSMPRDESR